MKQYTTNEQTAKLIKLGFENPSSISAYCKLAPYEYNAPNNVKIIVFDDTQYPIYNFSIGELLSFLPEKIDNDNTPDILGLYIDHNKMWTVDYSNILGELYSTYRTELIDALYDMIVKLKEEGVI